LHSGILQHVICNMQYMPAVLRDQPLSIVKQQSTAYDGIACS